MRTALEGCDAVVHCAGVVAIGPGAAERMSRTNLDGARNVLGQAVELGLDPVVYVSSLAAVFRPGLSTLTADLPVLGGLDDYGTVQGRGRGVRPRRSRPRARPVATTYPGMVIGPPVGDQIGEGTEGMLKALRLRRHPRAWTRPGRSATSATSAGSTRPCSSRAAARAAGPPAASRLGARGHRPACSDARPGGGWLHVPVPDALLRGFGRVQRPAAPAGPR